MLEVVEDFAFLGASAGAQDPGLRAFRYSMDVQGIGGDSPYFCVAELEFDDADAMTAAFDSEEGKAAVADVPNYATGGQTMVHFNPEA